MDGKEINIKQAELFIPIKFLNKALSQVGDGPNSCFEWVGAMDCQPENGSLGRVGVNLISTKLQEHLRIQFDQFLFNFKEGIYSCAINNIDLDNGVGETCLPECFPADNTNCTEHGELMCKYEKQTQTVIAMGDKLFKRPVGRPPLLDKPEIIKIPGETLNGEKRKRGRPRKDKTVKTLPDELESLNSSKEKVEDISQFADEKVLKVHCGTVSVGLSETQAPRKYGLRGVKLNAEIMDAVKGNVKIEDVDDIGEADEYIYPASSLQDVDLATKEDIMGNDTNNTQQQVSDENESVIDSEAVESEGLEDSDYQIENNDNINKKLKLAKAKRKLQIKNKNTPRENLTSLVASKVINKNKRPYNRVDLGNLPLFERRKKRSLNSMFTCKICQKRLSDYTGVYEHAKKLHGKKENIVEYLEELNALKVEQCGVCGMSFPDRWKLQSHEDREHIKNVPVSCFKCGSVLKNIQTLRNHIRWVHVQQGARRGLCHLCPASFRSTTTLKQHIDEIHYGNKYFQCDICKKKFYNRPQLKRHSRVHGLDESKRVFCKICDKSFLFKCNLQRHTEAVHSQQLEMFHCSYCGKGFGQKSGMVSHVQLVHFNLFPFSCKDCKSTFARSTMLKEHMASIHKQLDFKITEKLSKNSIYDKTEEDFFYCSYCSEGFRHKTKLVEHMHTAHSDAFPFSCKLCNQGFLEKTFLIMHNLKAHGIQTENQNEIEEKADDGKVGEILQIISSKAGFPNKVVSVQTSSETLETEEEMEVLTSAASSALVANAVDNQTIIQTTDGSAVMGTSSLFVEVASGSSTYRYLIEAPDTLGEDGSVTVAQDIASLLLAAEQTIQEEGAEPVNDQETTVQEINVVIDENNQIVSAADPSGNMIPFSEIQSEASKAINTMNNDASTDAEKLSVIDGEASERVESENNKVDVIQVQNGEDLPQMTVHEIGNAQNVETIQGQINIGNFTVKYDG